VSGENDHEHRHFAPFGADLSIATRWHRACVASAGRISALRTAIGLIGLGLLGGVAPTGIAGIAHAGAVLVGTAGALLALIVVCLAGAAAARRAEFASFEPRRQRTSIAPPQPASRSI
jgi:hypothetical protein